MKRTLIAAAALAAVPASAAHAAETIAYSYDARGRLVKVVRSGTAHGSTSVTTNYQYDKADNRTVKTTGSP